MWRDFSNWYWHDPNPSIADDVIDEILVYRFRKVPEAYRSILEESIQKFLDDQTA
jgi:hypothetical protein